MLKKLFCKHKYKEENILYYDLFLSWGDYFVSLNVYRECMRCGKKNRKREIARKVFLSESSAKEYIISLEKKGFISKEDFLVKIS